MSNAFLGAGWGFPVGLDGGGRIAMAEHEESIRQAIWLLLGTAPGERMMRPDFGCGIHDLVFGVNTPGTAGRVASEVRQSLLRWEPRIEVLTVDAGADPADPSRLLIKIEYRVRRTNSRFNLVYPFYLE
jgi:phage baseplate assembly protein W